MRKRWAFLLAVLLIGASCLPLEAKEKEVTLPAKNIIREKTPVDYTLKENRDKLYEQWQKGKPMLLKDKDYSKFKKDYWRFTNEIFREVGQKGNMIYSPLSMYLPLSEMSYALEDKSSPKEELVKLLRPSVKDKYWTAMLAENFEGSGYLTASSLWISEQAEPKMEFLKKTLTSDIYRVDFKSEQVMKYQMAWINKWTKGFLKDQVKEEDFKDQSDEREQLVARLIGTTYVKASWKSQYFADPKEDVFFAENGKKQKVPFLSSRPFETVYWEDQDVQAVKVPIQDGCFIALLPKKGKSLSDLLAKDVLLKISEDQRWQKAKVILHMPNFVQSSRLEILPVLEKLGYKEIGMFRPGYANLVGRETDGSDRLCRVAQVLQESKIEVNKEGIEAASYTKVDMNKTSAPPPEKILKVEIKIDRPYLYVLTNQSGLPSFVGINRDFEIR